MKDTYVSEKLRYFCGARTKFTVDSRQHNTKMPSVFGHIAAHANTDLCRADRESGTCGFTFGRAVASSADDDVRLAVEQDLTPEEHTYRIHCDWRRHTDRKEKKRYYPPNGWSDGLHGDIQLRTYIDVGVGLLLGRPGDLLKLIAIATVAAR